MIALGSAMSLEALASSPEIACDGTFTSSPEHFRQLYVLHGRIAPLDKDFHIEHDNDVRLRNAMRPLPYIFTTTKSYRMYEEIFKELKNVIETKTGKI